MEAKSEQKGEIVLLRTQTGRFLSGGNTLPTREKSPRIGLVLSGGGARGFAQIGVLQVLEEAGIEPYAIVGTSIGALVGGLYASGYSADDIDSVVRTTNWQELLGIGDEMERTELFVDQKLEVDRSLLTLRLDGLTPELPRAVSTGFRMTQFVEGLIWNAPYHNTNTFDDLKYRFRAVATDLISGNTVVLDSGNVAMALRASATVPLRFLPVPIDSMLLVDGGLKANIPVQAARNLGCDYIIVVNTTSPLLEAHELNTPWSVADQVVSLMMQPYSREQLEQADFVIEPSLGGIRSTDFSDPGGAVDSGRATAERVLARLLEQLPQRKPRTIGADRGEVHQPFLAYAAGGRYPSEPGDPLLHTVVPTGPERIPEQTIDSIRIIGLQTISRELILPAFLPLVGNHPNPRMLPEAVDNSVRNLRREGYSFFAIDSVGFQEGHLNIYADEGRIGSIRISGLESCAEFVVERELEFNEGDVFRADEAGEAVTRLLQTGFFSHARIDVRPLPDSGLQVVVQLKERSTALLRISARIDNERYTQLGVELAQENLFGMGTRIGARFAGGLRNRFLAADLRSNRIYGTYWTFGLSGYGRLEHVNLYERTVIPSEGKIRSEGIGEYKELRVGGRVRFGRQVERLGDVTIEGRFERQGAQGISAPSPMTGWQTLASLKFGTRFDTRNRVPYATVGTLVDLSYETSQSIFGADVSFVKLNAEGGVFIGFEQRHLLHPHFHIGFGDATLPIHEQFSLGGQGSMFGLREDELRGRQVMLASLEYRYLMPIRLYFDTYLSLRYDLGSAWSTPSEIRLNDLQHGVGFSVGLDTPVGPADFSLGRSFTLNKGGEPRLMNLGPIVAYFSLGYTLD